MNRNSNFRRGSFSNNLIAYCSSPVQSAIILLDCPYQARSLSPLTRSIPPLHTRAYSNAPTPALIRLYCSMVLVVVGTIRHFFLRFRSSAWVRSVM